MCSTLENNLHLVTLHTIKFKYAVLKLWLIALTSLQKLHQLNTILCHNCKKKNLYALDHTIILISRAGVGKTCSCVETMMIHFLK